MTGGRAGAAAHWSEALASWAIPGAVLARAPEPPWAPRPQVFVEAARRALAAPRTPTHHRVAEALPDGGSLLDVGAGGGAASLPLAPARLVAVDANAQVLEELVRLAPAGTAVDPVVGRWPAVADQAGLADVAVCANVAYDVPDLGAFAAALTDAARERVVLELTAQHPMSWLSPLWEHFWGLHRPTEPVAADALDVVREAVGADVATETWHRPHPLAATSAPERLALVRRRLCLPATADRELASLLDRLGDRDQVQVVTAWWDPRTRL